MATKLEVRSKGPNGFRRGGRFFGPDPVTVEIDDDAQADAIMREKQLYVRRLDGGAMPTDSAPNEEPPFASGLGDGSRFVPSDLTGGKPTGLSLDDAKPQATGTRRATVPEGSPPTDDERKRR